MNAVVHSIAAGLLRFDRKWLDWAKRFIWCDLILIDVLILIIAVPRPSE